MSCYKLTDLPLGSSYLELFNKFESEWTDLFKELGHYNWHEISTRLGSKNGLKFTIKLPDNNDVIVYRQYGKKGNIMVSIDNPDRDYVIRLFDEWKIKVNKEDSYIVYESFKLIHQLYCKRKESMNNFGQHKLR